MAENNSTSSSASAQTLGRAMGRRGPGNMGAPVEKPKEGKKTLIRLMGYFKPEMFFVVLLLITVVAGVVTQVLAPSFQSRAIDTLVTKTFDKLPALLITMIALYAFHGVMNLLQGYVSASLSQRVVRRLRSDLFNKIIHLPISYIDNHSHGDLMSRMTNDADNISSIISSSLTSLFSGILTLIGTVSIMIWYSPVLALLSCSTVVFTVLFTSIITKYMRKFYVKRQALLGRLNGTVEEKVTNLRTVSAYNYQEKTIKEFEENADDLTKTGIKAEIIGGSMGPVMNMFNNVSFVVVAVFGAYFALKGWITVGVISAFIIYSKQFSRPINMLAQLYGQIQTAIAGAERIFSILDVEEEDKTGEHLTEKTKGVIEFEHVNFSYVPGKRIINDFTLKIESGKKIALVGSTGCGKTTVINLLMRFYDLDSGRILLDGR
ncbi:MAG: ABC transporter ATP-binding protein, partial [Lachnospiraceae bacterium]|nr:ABC transporter ATP-binding protein [Lachnospiraceae bacterium]